MTGHETAATPDAGAAAATERTPRERVAAFPWPAGLAAGVGAFAATYAIVLLYVLAGIAQVTGSITDRLVTVGFIVYTAQNVPLTADAGPSVVAVGGNLVAKATQPLVYQAVPVLALVVAGAAVTRYTRPDRRSALTAVLVGCAVAVGYLLVALVGTYVFTRTQQAGPEVVVYHPDRLATLGYGLAYPLVCGVVGSLGAQAVLE
ncbi:MAG: hypothetical protein ABEJ31_04940 [Haloarculaceae archaeon]